VCDAVRIGEDQDAPRRQNRADVPGLMRKQTLGMMVEHDIRKALSHNVRGPFIGCAVHHYDLEVAELLPLKRLQTGPEMMVRVIRGNHY